MLLGQSNTPRIAQVCCLIDPNTTLSHAIAYRNFERLLEQKSLFLRKAAVYLNWSSPTGREDIREVLIDGELLKAYHSQGWKLEELTQWMARRADNYVHCWSNNPSRDVVNDLYENDAVVIQTTAEGLCNAIADAAGVRTTTNPPESKVSGDYIVLKEIVYLNQNLEASSIESNCFSSHWKPTFYKASHGQTTEPDVPPYDFRKQAEVRLALVNRYGKYNEEFAKVALPAKDPLAGFSLFSHCLNDGDKAQLSKVVGYDIKDFTPDH